jgi:drug/metabolite transporter (DMT)-like permease
MSAFFVLTAWALWRSGQSNRWIALTGLVTGVLGWVGMFRNVTPLVSPIAAINNYLLPLWMIMLGVVLLRVRPTVSAEEDRRNADAVAAA